MKKLKLKRDCIVWGMADFPSYIGRPLADKLLKEKVILKRKGKTNEYYFNFKHIHSLISK